MALKCLIRLGCLQQRQTVAMATSPAVYCPFLLGNWHAKEKQESCHHIISLLKVGEEVCRELFGPWSCTYPKMVKASWVIPSIMPSTCLQSYPIFGKNKRCTCTLYSWLAECVKLNMVKWGMQWSCDLVVVDYKKKGGTVKADNLIILWETTQSSA